MGTQLITPKKTALPDSYTGLRSRVQKILFEGRTRAQELVEKEKLHTYWEVGRQIDRYLQTEGDGKAPYGEKVVQRLAEDLHSDDELLYKALKLARAYPNFDACRKLSWTRHRFLLSVQDEKLRKELTRKARREDWSASRIQKEIRKFRDEKKKKEEPKPAPVRLRARRGRLNTYRIIERGGHLEVDLGFDCSVGIGSNTGSCDPVRLRQWPDATVRARDPDAIRPRRSPGVRVGAGNVVQGTTLPTLTKVENATKADLYTYNAAVERVVDGDTVWVIIELGFGFRIRQKLRLRGIDCPEMSTPAGLRAKQFVQECLAPVGARPASPAGGRDVPLQYCPILITTLKTPDKYDRYLTDVYLPSSTGTSSSRRSGTGTVGASEEVYLNKLLVEQGHAKLV